MGAIYGLRAAAHEQRLQALVALAGPYNLGECWDSLNPLTRAGYIFYTKSADEADARRTADTLNVEGTYYADGGRTHIHYLGATSMSEPSLCAPARAPGAARFSSLRLIRGVMPE